MAGTYSQIYIQIVFAVNGRINLMQEQWRQEVFKYMTGIIQGKNQKSIIVNGTANHVHLFVGMKPSMSISDLVRDIKNNSTNFINERKFVAGKFTWQEGYGSFSYSHSQIGQVYKYIQNQENHHKQKTFREEYIDFLRKFDVSYDERYLFDWVEE